MINDEKATAVIEHITYDILDDCYGTDVFTDPTIKGRLGVNAMKAKKHLYDHIVYDSTGERDFATELDTNTSVAVYVKLPVIETGLRRLRRKPVSARKTTGIPRKGDRK